MADPDFRAERPAREASVWFVRLSNPLATEDDRRGFRDWLDEHPANAEAMAEARVLWARLEEPAREVARRGAPGRRAGLRIAAAIAAVTVIAGGALWRDPGLLDRLRADEATAPGQHLDMALADGSRLYLDGDSAVVVRLGEDGRDVTVLRGRVWFEVARDESRPFRVHSRRVETMVLGTAFGVDGDAGLITVEHGRVAVSAEGARTELMAGEAVSALPRGLSEKTKIDPGTALAWRRGLIVLDAAPLGAVADELARMAPGRVVIADSGLRALKLSGVFSASDPGAVLEAMRSALGLKTVSVPGFATIVYR